MHRLHVAQQEGNIRSQNQAQASSQPVAMEASLLGEGSLSPTLVGTLKESPIMLSQDNMSKLFSPLAFCFKR